MMAAVVFKAENPGRHQSGEASDPETGKRLTTRPYTPQRTHHLQEEGQVLIRIKAFLNSSEMYTRLRT